MNFEAMNGFGVVFEVEVEGGSWKEQMKALWQSGFCRARKTGTKTWTDIEAQAEREGWN